MTVENWLEFVGWAACAGTFSWLAVGLLKCRRMCD